MDPLSRYLSMLKEHRRPGYGDYLGAAVGTTPETPSLSLGMMYVLFGLMSIIGGGMAVLNYFYGEMN